jgi:hypothetical protein
MDSVNRPDYCVQEVKLLSPACNNINVISG